jgi:muconolactone delta-isomerase
MGFDHISIARRTAFVEVVATDEEAVGETMATLPLFKFFDIDIYPTVRPGPPQAATAA